MKNTRFYRSYVVVYDRVYEDTIEHACCHRGPHTSWQVAEECARLTQRLYGGSIVTREVPDTRAKRSASGAIEPGFCGLCGWAKSCPTCVRVEREGGK